jgi:inner membrane protein
MDSLTHIVLGACIGEAFAGKQVGKKALIWGALAQSVPDIDFIAAFWLNPAKELLAHRGFTHSLLFGASMTFFLALVAERWHRPHEFTLRKWIYFFATEIFVHLLLDACNAYGVGWFEPFSSYRISFNTLFVADPFFSIWPAISFAAILILKTTNRNRVRWAKWGIAFCIIYTAYAFYNKMTITQKLREIARVQKINYDRSFSTPTPLNNWLWYVVMQDSNGYHITYRSVFDRSSTAQFEFFPRNDILLRPFENQEDLRLLKRFSQGYYTSEMWSDTLVFNDLRFGQIIGWRERRARFAFHYFLQYPDNNEVVVQRGRFAGWNRAAFISLVQRIKGN